MAKVQQMSQHKMREVFFLSDGTGVTAEALGSTLLTQFSGTHFMRHTIAFINGVERAIETVTKINSARNEHGRPLIFSTVVNANLRAILAEADGLFIDLFAQNIEAIEHELEETNLPVLGQAHGISDTDRYLRRMAAIEYAIEHDDGQSMRALSAADVILLAPSRCGKTPTCMYLAIQYGIKAANFPLVDEDFESQILSATIKPLVAKTFGLTTTPQRLHEVRSERRQNSKYASLDQCRFEIQATEKLYRANNIPYIDSSAKSIEEIASVIMDEKNLRN